MSQPAKQISAKEVVPSATPLTIVDGAPSRPLQAPKSDRSLRIIAVFILCTFTAIASLFLISTRRVPEMKQSIAKFNSLHEVYRQEGMKKFLEAKKSLKEDISQVLSSSADKDAHNQATNIAVYLFPDILAGDDFEKSAALEDWAPLESKIERAPRTAQSRADFEELRANIWNYESPERAQPNLSVTAKEVIRIYEQLSAP